jgi:hypothetical protein
VFGIDNDPDWPDPDQQALDADPESDPAKRCRPDPIRNQKTALITNNIFLF